MVSNTRHGTRALRLYNGWGVNRYGFRLFSSSMVVYGVKRVNMCRHCASPLCPYPVHSKPSATHQTNLIHLIISWHRAKQFQASELPS